MVMIENVSSYVICHPLQFVNSTSTAKALRNILYSLPYIREISCDGGSEYSAAFADECLENGICLQTSINQRSNPQGNVENSIRQIKNIL